MKRTGDLKLMQELNRYLILDAIRKRGPISRAQIAQDLGVSPTTVTAAVSDLIESGLVQEAGQGESTYSGGRRPVLIEFCPDNQFVIAVSITNFTIDMAALNLDCKVIQKEATPFNTGIGEDLVEELTECIDRFLRPYESLAQCIGISIVTPGIVDSDKGILRYNAKLDLRDIPLKQSLEKKFGLKVWVENDANALAIAEREMGAEGPSDNMVFVTIGDGIGTGIILNGSLYRGAKGGAGELGHISVDKNGPNCECGNRGCLESFISWPSLYAKICSAIVRGIPTMLSELSGGDLNRITPTVFQRALMLEDDVAIEIANEAAHYLATGLVTLANILNPDAIVLDGELFQRSTRFLSKVKESVSKTVLQNINDELITRYTTLGEDGKLIGAATVALNDVFHFSL